MLESALSGVSVCADSSEAADILMQLGLGASGCGITKRLPQVPMAEMLQFLGFLVAARLVCGRQHQESVDFAMWEFHDLLFHRLTRVTDLNREFATFKLRGKVDPPPPFKEPVPSVSIRLPKPDLDALAKADMPLTRALESRRSKRIAAEIPLTVDQLAEFLYRCAHVQEIRTEDELQRTRVLHCC
jgi:oxazoline/thiazoline dehydrogenase